MREAGKIELNNLSQKKSSLLFGSSLPDMLESSSFRGMKLQHIFIKYIIEIVQIVLLLLFTS